MTKRRMTMLLCAAALTLCMASPPTLAADRSAACYYPVEVESYTAGDFDQPRIRKVYQLSLSDDPAGIPTEDFEEYGMTFHFIEMTRKADVGVDTQPLTKTVTTDSDTGDLGEILKQLAPEIEAETEDGYAGVLKLDYNSVKAEAKGYKTTTRSLSASRTYPNLSDANLSMVPKTVTEGGRTLTLADVKWSGGEDGYYTATASYTGSVSSRYCTGYTVTADYTGEVAKTSCEIVTYTAIFGCTEVPYSNTSVSQEDGNQNCEGQEDGPSESKAPEDSSPESKGPENTPTESSGPAVSAPAPSGGNGSTALSIAGCVGGVASLLAAGYWGFEKFKERKANT